MITPGVKGDIRLMGKTASGDPLPRPWASGAPVAGRGVLHLPEPGAWDELRGRTVGELADLPAEHPLNAARVRGIFGHLMVGGVGCLHITTECGKSVVVQRTLPAVAPTVAGPPAENGGSAVEGEAARAPVAAASAATVAPAAAERETIEGPEDPLQSAADEGPLY